MADIFDRIIPDKGDIFDRIAVTMPPPQGDIFDRIQTQPERIPSFRTLTPETEARSRPLTDIETQQVRHIPDDWATIGKKVLTDVLPAYAKSAGSTIEAIGKGLRPYEVTLSPEGKVDIGRQKKPTIIESVGREARQYWDKKLREDPILTDPGTLKEYLASVAQGVVHMTPAIAVGIITGNPVASLGVIGVDVFGNEYATQIEAGASHEQATMAALGYSAAEVIGESVPLNIILKPGGPVLKKALKSMGTEGAEEWITSLLQSGIRKGTIEPDMTFKEALDRANQEGLVGAGVGGVIGTAAHPFTRETKSTTEEVPLSGDDKSQGITEPVSVIEPKEDIFDQIERKQTEAIPPPKPPLTGEGSTPKGKPPDKPIDSETINKDYESLKDTWFAEKDWQAQKATVESAKIQDQIKVTTGEKGFKDKSQTVDKAIQIYIDTKRNPEHVTKYWDKLTPKQQAIVTLSQNLTPEQQAIANEVDAQYQDIGEISKDAEIIRNTLDNYVGRVWDVKQPKMTSEQFRKFGTKTRHAKARTFETIIEGWANGYNLKVEGATNNLSILKEEIHNTIQDKAFIKQLQGLKDLEGNPVISTKQLDGYVRVEHPNFKTWKFASQTTPADLQGKNFVQTPEGTILERQELYAPKHIARNLNNIMGVSKLKGIKAIDVATKYNATIKAWVLQTSFFHHLAFMRSYYLGSSPFGEVAGKIKSGEGFIKSIKGLTPRQAYKSGQEAISNLEPEIELLVKNGLTLGKIQEWEESILRNEEIFIEKWMDKYGATKAIKDKIQTFRQNQADFLFKQFGAGLKAKAALIELRSMMKKHPNMDPNKAAKITANLINDDFGGLHLKRMGRDPTVQHIFRLFALAPDWTESNIRSAVKAFKKGEEGQVYRHFWARIITKSMLATLAVNALLHGDDLPEQYGKAWKSGRLRWLDIDITPVYKAVGGETDAKKYFSVIGHFKDPLKFALYPVKSAHYKGSPIYKAIFENITGEDWAGREFTELPELRKTGATVRPKNTFAGAPNKYSQMPSYLINQLKGTQPIQVQQLLNWWMGETEAFDAIGQSMGLGVRTTYAPTPEQKRKEKAIRKAIKKLHPKRSKR